MSLAPSQSCLLFPGEAAAHLQELSARVGLPVADPLGGGAALERAGKLLSA